MVVQDPIMGIWEMDQTTTELKVLQLKKENLTFLVEKQEIQIGKEVLQEIPLQEEVEEVEDLDSENRKNEIF